RLRLPRHPARDHRHLHPALAPLRQVLPHLPAPGPTGRELLQGRRREGRASPLPPLRRAVRLRAARPGPDRRRAPARLPLRAHGPGAGALPVDLPALSPGPAGAGPGTALGERARRYVSSRHDALNRPIAERTRDDLMAQLPTAIVDLIDHFGP